MSPDENEYYDSPEVTGADEPLDMEEQGQLEALAQHEPELEEETLPEEIMVTDPLQLIPIAISKNRMLQIQYQNRRGETKLYVVEPYEIGGNQSHPAGYLWAFDRNAGTIKSFFISNLLDIQLLEETFIPRG